MKAENDENISDIEYRKIIRQIEHDKHKQKKDIYYEMKRNFKHIEGMWPKTAKFTSDEQ